jgi:Glucodextranase, domain B
MKKEVFLAVLVGFVLGLLITFGVWTANRSLKPNVRPNIASSLPTPLPSPVSQESSPSVVNLSITSPADETLTGTDTITLSGKTSPGAAVAVTYEGGEEILTADTTGAFSTDIKLEGGYNRITATAFDQNGNQNSQEILVTYSTTKI